MGQPLCNQLTAKGEPCQRRAVAGYDRCATHLGTARKRTLLTRELADQLVVMLRAGNYLEVAARAVGVHRHTLADWRARGRSGAPGDEDFVELAERMEKALAEGEARNVAQIATARYVDTGATH